MHTLQDSLESLQAVHADAVIIDVSMYRLRRRANSLRGTHSSCLWSLAKGRSGRRMRRSCGDWT